MKTKSKSLVRGKRVNYFNHDYGVVNGRSKSGLKVISGLMSAVIVLGGLGVGVTKVIDHTQSKKSVASLQRESVTGDVDKKSGQADQLKSATTKAREDEALAKEIKNKLKNVPGGQKWSVYVRDLNSDRMASINADDTREAAGFGNLMMTLPLESKTSSERWGYKAGRQTISNAVQSMINKNDKDSAQSLTSYVDMKNADSLLNGQGFKKTTIQDKTKKTTAREMGDLLYRLQNSQLLSDKARRVVFDGLYGQQQRDGLPKACVTPECLTANVTSEDNGARHDAAIITSGDTKYVVVIMTNSGSWSQIADVSKDIFQMFKP